MAQEPARVLRRFQCLMHPGHSPCRAPKARACHSVVLLIRLRDSRMDEDVSSPPADRPNRQRMFASQLNFFRSMADHETFALTQFVLHLLKTDFDLQHLTAVG